MSDLINRADAIEAVRGCKFHAIKGSLQTAPWYEAINEVLEILSALPSAEAVNMEEHVKELNDVASAWKNKLINAEKIADQQIRDAFNSGYSCGMEQTKEALSAEAVQVWIPCSEMLPSESGWYVVSVVGFENITDVSYFYSDELKWSDISHTQSITAWMPLPKPYKGGEDK